MNYRNNPHLFRSIRRPKSGNLFLLTFPFFFYKLCATNQLRRVVDVEQRVLAEIGELCHKPLANQSIAVCLDADSVVSEKVVFLVILTAVGKPVHKGFHILIGEVLELITVELLACALGGIVAWGCVCPAGNGQSGDGSH